MSVGSRDALIAASSVDLARRLGLRVVAEGVETTDVLGMLDQMGCHEAQGFLFTAPVPEREFIDWLLTRKANGDAAWPELPLTPTGKILEILS